MTYPALALLLASTVTSDLAATAAGPGPRLLPASARLDGPKARQRFLVETSDGNAFTGDCAFHHWDHPHQSERHERGEEQNR